MKIIDCEQGSPLWHAARLGIPTASNFSKILTPTGKPSASASGYMYELLAERLLNCPVEAEATAFMERGTQLEADAVRYYELQRDLDARKVGFVLEDGGRFGCSPDRLIGEDGGLEVKCPSAPVHVGYLLDDLPAKFKPQVQGCLWITGRAWWDVLAFNPDLPSALVRVERDEKYIADLAAVVAAFCEVLEQKHQELIERFGLNSEWRRAA